MCAGYVQILYHFIYRTWASTDFGIQGGPGTNPLWLLRDDYISLRIHSTFWSHQEFMHMIIDFKNSFDFQKQRFWVIIQKVLALNDYHLWLCFTLRIWDFKCIVSLFWYANYKSRLGNSPWVLLYLVAITYQTSDSLCVILGLTTIPLGKVFEMQVLGPPTPELVNQKLEVGGRGAAIYILTHSKIGDTQIN